MGLYFRNSTNVTVSIAYAYSNPNCRGSRWQKRGWFIARPGERILVHTGYVGNRAFYFYAKGGRQEWSGVYYTRIPETRFTYCWDVSVPSWRLYGFTPIYTSILDYDYTVNLVAGSSRRKLRTKTGVTVWSTRMKEGNPLSGKRPVPLRHLHLKKGTMKPSKTVGRSKK